MHIFIDTNIFLDLILKRENYKEALQIFNAIEKKLFDASILDITILNIDYVAKKQIQNMDAFLSTINQLFQVLGASNQTIEKALNIDNNDLEDNVQYVCAKEAGCEIIITNDKNFYSESIEKVSSIEFVHRYL
jgi:predicted nucleic acid-binding protein